MPGRLRKFPILFIILVLPPLIYVVLSTGYHNFETLPYYGEKQISSKIIDGKETIDTIYHTVADFSFTNQYGETVTRETFKDKIYVADYFFTSCGSICPKMSDQLAVLQEKFRNNDNVMILSHTVNPENDSVSVLNDYAKKMGAIKGKWHFVTGDKKELYEMALYSYFINAMEDVLAPEGFLHSEMFVLVDKEQHIRGFYDGTDPVQVQDLIKAIQLLVSEAYIPKKDKNSS